MGSCEGSFGNGQRSQVGVVQMLAGGLLHRQLHHLLGAGLVIGRSGINHTSPRTPLFHPLKVRRLHCAVGTPKS